MAEIADVVQVNGVPMSGVTVQVYRASSFVTPPVANTPLPGSPVATVVTGTTGPGAFQVSVPDVEDYWAGASVLGQIGWQLYPLGQNEGGGGGFTNPMTTPGDMIDGGAAGAAQRLPIGANGQVLEVVAGVPAWTNPSAGFTNPMTTAGDMIDATSGGTAQRLPIGSAGQVLIVSGGAPTWGTAPGFANPMTTAGDLIDGGAAGAPQRLAAGSNGQVLTMVTGAPAWAASAAGFVNPMTTAGDLIDGGSGGTAQRLGIGSNGQVLTAVSGVPAWAAPGGSSTVLGPISAYILYNDGSKFHITFWNTGVDAYSSTSAATIANNLGTLLNTSSQPNPVVIFADPSVSLSGTTWATYGSGFAILGMGGGLQNASAASYPNLGTMNLGVSGHSGNMCGITFDKVTFEGEIMQDYGTISDIYHNQVGYQCVNAHCLQILPTQNQGIQYLRWTGCTEVTVQTGAANQEFCLIAGSGAQNQNLGHSYFEYISQVGGCNGTPSSWYLFHIGVGTQWQRLEVAVLDMNTNQGFTNGAGDAYIPVILQLDGGANLQTQMMGTYFGAIAWENHQSPSAYVVQVGNFTGSGNVFASIFIGTIWTNSKPVALFNNQMTSNSFTGNSIFLHVGSITPENQGMTTGTWNEDATVPIRVGPCTGQSAPMNSGDYLTHPVSSAAACLSLAGTAAFVSGTTYTVGGTKLGCYVPTGTVTLTTANGTALLSAVALTNEIFSLEPQMQFRVTGYGATPPLFWKGE